MAKAEDDLRSILSNRTSGSSHGSSSDPKEMVLLEGPTVKGEHGESSWVVVGEEEEVGWDGSEASSSWAGR